MSPKSDVDFEAELRRLYAEVAAPTLSSGRKQPTRSAVLPSSQPAWRNAWVIRGVAGVAALAVLGVSAITASRGGPSNPPRVSTAPALKSGPLTLTVQRAGADLGCTLPISALSADHTVGFVHMHEGHGSFEPVATSGNTYVPRLHRWIAELPNAVSLDGGAYFTQDLRTGDLKVVDASGERTLGLHPDAVGWLGRDIVVFAPDNRSDSNGPTDTSTLSLVDSVSGATRTLGSGPRSGNPSDLGLGGSTVGYLPVTHAFWVVINHRDGSTTADSFDVATGATTRWLETAGFVQIVAADQSGHPIVQIADRDIAHVDPAGRGGIGIQTVLLTAPGARRVLNAGHSGEAGVADNLSPLSVTDGDIVWLAGDNGQVWRYTPAGGMQLILKVTTSTQGAPGVVVSGPCR